MTSAERPPLLSNPIAERVRKVAGLAGRSARSRAGLLRVEGPQAVRELLAHRPYAVRDVYISTEVWDRHEDIVSLADSVTYWVHPTTSEVATAMAPDAQGVIATATPDAIISTCPVFYSELTGSALIIAQGRDPGNVGTMIRSADAFGAIAVLTVRGTVDVTSPKVIRSTAGSIFHLPVIPCDSFDEAVEWVHDCGGEVLGTSGRVGAVNLDESFVFPRFHAWAMGNEAQGLSDEELDACDALVKIPMTGAAESLNVSTAASVCLFSSQQTLHSGAQSSGGQA